MPLSKQEWLALEKKAHELRRLCLDTTYWAGSGHIGGGMSVRTLGSSFIICPSAISTLNSPA